MQLTIFLHVITESFFALFCILAAIYTWLYKMVSRGFSTVLAAVLLTSGVINIADALAYLFRGNVSQTGYVMVRVCNFAVFAGMFALLALGCALLDKVLEIKGAGADKKLRNFTYIVCFAGFAALVLSRFFGAFYVFDDQNVYHRAGGYALMPLMAICAILIMIARTVKEREALKRREFMAFMCLWLLPVAGAVMQIFFYGISFSNLANSIALLIMITVLMRGAMDERSIKKSIVLSGESIEEVSADLDGFLKSIGTEKQNRIRIRFTVEDALIRMWQHFKDPCTVKVSAGFSLRRPTIRIENDDDTFNPFSKTGSGLEDLGSGLLALAGLSPTYSYSRGTNIIRINLSKRSMNPVIAISIAIVFGLMMGSTALFALDPADAAFVTADLLMPVYDLWNNILYSVAAPAMFIIVMSTMLDTREVSEQGGNTGRITGRYFALSLLVGLVTLGSAAVIRSDSFSYGAMTRETAAEIIRGLFSVIPQNLLDPFKDFNTAQLILMGMIFAYAVMAVGQQAAGLAALIRQLNMISTQLAEWIAELVPLFTAFLTAKLALERNAYQLLGLLKVIPFALAVSLVWMAVTILYVGSRMKVSPGILLRKTWPSFLLTFRTGQVSDSYALAEKCCIRDLGIQKIFTQRLLPLGLVLYMPVSIIGMLSFVVFSAIKSGIAITPLWMLTAIVFALILTVAAPPIPGINLLSYVVIMGQLGIGMQYVIAAMIFDIIFNMFASAANQMMLQMDMVLRAEGMGLLDRRKLAAEPAQ